MEELKEVVALRQIEAPAARTDQEQEEMHQILDELDSLSLVDENCTKNNFKQDRQRQAPKQGQGRKQKVLKAGSSDRIISKFVKRLLKPADRTKLNNKTSKTLQIHRLLIRRV